MRVTTIGIIGAGTMGSGIAQVCAGAGLDVILTDVNETIVKKGAAAVAGISIGSSPAEDFRFRTRRRRSRASRAPRAMTPSR